MTLLAVAAATGCAIDSAAGVREVCFYSSAAVYGDAAYPHDENAAPKPQGPYGGSKLAGEKAWRAWADRSVVARMRRRGGFMEPSLWDG